MITLARGSQAVGNLERSLVGTPPKAALQKTRADLHRHMHARFKAKKKSLEESARLAEPLRALMMGHISKDDPKLKKHIEDTKALYKRRSAHKIKPPKREKFEARFAVGSNFWSKEPPYDGDPWTYQSNNLAEVIADSSAGTYHLAMQSLFGQGLAEAGAGLPVWFYAFDDHPQEQFGAIIDYSDDWWDSAFGYVAHNDLTTNLWVWGPSENSWVSQSAVSPSWSDGASYLEEHGNDPQGDSARITVQTFFPARRNNWYLGWVWSDASVYTDAGLFGSAPGSSIQLDISVPLVFFYASD